MCLRNDAITIGIRNHAWTFAIVGACLYLPYVVCFLTIEPPRAWSTLPVAPGWIPLMLLDLRVGANTNLAAGLLTASIYVGLTWLGTRSPKLGIGMPLIALMFSAAGAVLFRFLVLLAGR
jgi:hypothetical protein